MRTPARSRRPGELESRRISRRASKHRAGRAVLLVALIGGLLLAERRVLEDCDSYGLAAGWSPIPSGTALRRLSFDQVMADVMWLRTLQYYGKQRIERAPMPRLQEYIDATVELDPGFVAPYVFGGIVLAEDLNQPDAAIDLLLRGIAANPKRWELPFELGFLLYIDLDQPKRAGMYFEHAASRENCPRMARRFATWAYTTAGSRDDAKKVCGEIIRFSEDENMQRFAQRMLTKIQIGEDLEYLQAGISQYRDRTGRWPPCLEVLVEAGEIAEIPDEPEGGFYAYRPETGEVGSSSQIQLALDRHSRQLEDSIARYKARRGRFPPSLECLVTEGLLREVRTVFGFRFAYDPDSGRVWPVDPWRT
jgi:hypothetical protein